MRIFLAGIETETNTFSPVPTALDDFNVVRGADVRRGRVEHPTLDLSATWGRQALERGDEFVFSLMAWSQPSGITVRSAYEALRNEMLRDLRASMPVDVVLLKLLGAMVAEGYDDCDEDMIRRVRDIVGPGCIIGVEFDLHCNLSESKIAAADVVITYKEYPHTDIHERARELFDIAVATKLGQVRPTMALFDCRMMGLYPTSRRPLREVVDAMTEVEQRRQGVLSMSFGHGFPFGDVPHAGAKMLVVTDSNPALAEQVAREFGLRLYDLRREISFDSLSFPMEEALSRALASKLIPVVVADQSDNTGGGAPGDSTFALRWLLERGGMDAALGIMYDPQVVKIAKKVGVGATLAVRLGGKMGPFSGAPVDLDVRVCAVRDSYMHALPQKSGDPWWFPAGDVVALRHGSIDIVVSSERCQCFSPSVFSDLGIDPLRKRLLIPKSFQHFHDAFQPIAAEIIYMAAPGAVPPTPKLIPYRRLDVTNMYPWVDDPLAA